MGDARETDEAEQLKLQANEQFSKGRYDEAISLYTAAIEKNDTNAIYFSNRSFAHLKLESYGYALSDANKSIEINPSYVKAYYRRGSANFALGKFKLAVKDFEHVAKAKPNDADAQKRYKECDKIVKRIAFERAIAVDDPSSAVEVLDLSAMVIEDTYKGPCLKDDSIVTAEFMEELMLYLKNQNVLHRKYAYSILLQIKSIFEKEPTLVDIYIPDGNKITVCGDIHGQFYDLMNIFQLNGVPSESNPYLFNGDFVDRGSFSVEVVLTLFGYKVLYPKHVYLARGNHESITMNNMYGFEAEVNSKYSNQMFKIFTEVYCLLPLCHALNNQVLIMHGGLFSEDGVTLQQIRETDRMRQPPDSGIMCDLLWSDPQPMPGRSPSKRGVGIHFGPDVTKRFLDNNGLKYIIRSHEVKMEGYEVAHGGKCITVFSAPNYIDQMGNKGAFITLTAPELTPKYTTFDSVPHPKVSSYVMPFFLM